MPCINFVETFPCQDSEDGPGQEVQGDADDADERRDGTEHQPRRRQPVGRLSPQVRDVALLARRQ